MGNQASVQQHPPLEGAPGSRPASSTIQQNIRNLLKPPGALGLSKAELDKRCQSSGLYPSCAWDDKQIRRLIGDGKLAGRWPGTELRTLPCSVECPICFLHYPEVNVTKCCLAKLCSECYLQVRPQRLPNSPCPFCNCARLQIAVAKRLDPKAIQQREEEEQVIIEATIRARAESKLQISSSAYAAECVNHESDTDFATTTNFVATSNNADYEDLEPETAAPATVTASSTTTGYGSSLAQNDRVATIRARSESFASESSSHNQLNVSSEHLIQDITALAMTPEERTQLEEEMRAQHIHPLAQRMEAEQAERRLQNERDYHRTQLGRLRELRARRDLMSRTLGMSSNSDAANGTGSSSPPARRNDRSVVGSPHWNRMISAMETSGSARSLDELVVLEAAIMLSMEEEAGRIRGSTSSGPPGRAGSAADDRGILPSDTNGTAELGSHMNSLLRTLQSRRQASGLMRNIARPSPDALGDDAALDIASMLLSGISEEEQIAMAIAESLTESNTPPSSSSPVDANGTESRVGPAAASETALREFASRLTLSTDDYAPDEVSRSTDAAPVIPSEEPVEEGDLEETCLTNETVEESSCRESMHEVL